MRLRSRIDDAQARALVGEIRRDRKKWGGVVSRSIVGRGYLTRHVENWRRTVKRMETGK